jgi:hypothetical protein
MKTLCLAAVLSMLTLGTITTSAREWTDATGSFTVEADLVDIVDGKVRLKKENGKILSVPLAKLCKSDQEHLKKTANPFDDGEDDSFVSPSDLTGKPTELANDDGRPSGKKSFPRGMASAFETPEGEWYITAVRIHGGRYGHPAPPKENFHITVCDEEFKPIVDFPFPYKKFPRTSPKWVALRVKPTRVPAKFVLCADFNAKATKGVYVSHDAQGRSLVGKPGKPSGHFTGGDWMIRVQVDQLKKATDAKEKGVKDDTK